MFLIYSFLKSKIPWGQIFKYYIRNKITKKIETNSFKMKKKIYFQ